MKKIIASMIIAMVGCVFIPTWVDAQPRGERGRGIAEQSRGRHRRYRGGKWEWYESPAVGRAVGSFFGNLLRQQATRPGREATVETDEATLEPWSPGWIAYCKRKYKSFDIKDGRYLSYDGNRYFCK